MPRAGYALNKLKGNPVSRAASGLNSYNVRVAGRSLRILPIRTPPSPSITETGDRARARQIDQPAVAVDVAIFLAHT